MLGLLPQAKKVWFEGGFSFKPQMLGVVFHLDENPMYVQVPADKVRKATDAIHQVISLRWAPAELCQSLLGILTFHGRILLAGKWHLPCTVQALGRACQEGVAPVTDIWKEELRWWRTLLTGWNRRSILVPRTYMRGQQTPLEVPLTDASRARGKHSGAGAVLGALYCHYVFTAHEVAHLTIMDLEGLAAVLWVKYLC